MAGLLKCFLHMQWTVLMVELDGKDPAPDVINYQSLTFEKVSYDRKTGFYTYRRTRAKLNGTRVKKSSQMNAQEKAFAERCLVLSGGGDNGT